MWYHFCYRCEVTYVTDVKSRMPLMLRHGFWSKIITSLHLVLSLSLFRSYFPISFFFLCLPLLSFTHSFCLTFLFSLSLTIFCFSVCFSSFSLPHSRSSVSFCLRFRLLFSFCRSPFLYVSLFISFFLSVSFFFILLAYLPHFSIFHSFSFSLCPIFAATQWIRDSLGKKYVSIF